jgi:hypothetical protein
MGLELNLIMNRPANDHQDHLHFFFQIEDMENDLDVNFFILRF